jgi:CubicO group peptidase (beta-lactamase class C family)
MNSGLLRILYYALMPACLCCSTPALTVAAQVSHSGPKPADYGEGQGFPVGDGHTWNELSRLVGSYSHFDAIFPARGIPHPSDIWNFRRDRPGLKISYSFNGRSNSLDDYLSHVAVTGLLIGKDDRILVERYQYGRTDRDRFTSASMAKSIVALLLGVASADHPAFSVTRLAQDFVPGLRHTAYGETTVRDLLHMTSGVIANDGLLVHKLYAQRLTGDETVLGAFYRRPTKAGAHFHYSCGDSETLGLILHDLVREPLATYLSEKIWQPIGTEEDGSWSVDTSGEEVTCFGLNATLRDWGRVARLLASDGNWDGKQIIPRQWLVEATTIQWCDPELEPGIASERFGYGYQLWILPGARRMFALIGADGQFILADPASKLYMVQTAVVPSPADRQTAETMALWQSLVQPFGQ